MFFKRDNNRMNNNPLVSVIVPVYNERKYLKECVTSICEQKYYNIEVLLIDDGSTDGTGDDCDELAKADERIRVIHKKNGGLSAARVTGLENSSGEWILFVDDDDVISPHLIDVLISQVEENIDIVAGGRVDQGSAEYAWNDPQYITKTVLSGVDAVEKIPDDKQRTIITPLWGKIYRHSFLKTINLHKYELICPVIFFEDVLMTPILYSKARKICIVEETLYLHREVSTSISRSGKLSNFYFNQIESGSILLDYSKNLKLEKYYAYQLGIYINTILRIWALSERTEFEIYRGDILTKYNRFYSEYFKYSNDSLFRKMIISMFKINPVLWRKIVGKLYYKK